MEWAKAPSAVVTVWATSCWVAQVTSWPTLTCRAVGKKAKLSVVTAVPPVVVPAALLVGPPP